MTTTRTATNRRAQSNREAWLTEALRLLTPVLRTMQGEHMATFPPPFPKVRVSVGWPGGKRKKGTVLGQCWTPEAAADGLSQIFISPIVADGREAIGILVHEFAHAVDRNESGHSGRFAYLATWFGLEGKPTETHMGVALTLLADKITRKLGKYPHAALSDAATDGTKKQTTRMLKLTCACAEPRVIRLSRKAIDAGPILCGVCVAPFLPEPADDDEDQDPDDE